MLRIGEKVPDFTLRLAKADGTKEPVALSTLLAEGPVVLSFFPIAFSGVCTPHMCELSQELRALQAAGVRNVVGFSTDAQHVNVAFARHERLLVPIYSDPNREVVHRVWRTTTTAGVHDCAVRGWMLIDSDGTLRAQWAAPDPEVWSGVKPILEALQDL